MMPLDPAIAAFLARDPGIQPGSLSDLRIRTDAALVAMQMPVDAPGPVRDFGPDGSDLESPVPIRAYWPFDPDAGARMPSIVFAHGGGWCLGSLDGYDNPCRSLADATGCVVFSVGYRLAPEHPFPAPLDDVYSALCWVADHARALGLDPRRLVLAGDSAGGNLAAAAASRARDEAGPRIAHQLLFYPALDTDFETPSYRRFGEGYHLTRDVMRFCWEAYLGSLGGPIPDHAVPGRAVAAGLPPTTIFVCEFDPLRSEGEDYAAKLDRAGVPVTLVLLEGMVHACLHMTGLTPAARSIFARAAEALRRHVPPAR